MTIATNMAGRGTDIVLGDGVADAGGLHIIGTERHESRRIDNQLRGRAGRQGDPGSVAVLRLARRRADAPLRLRAHRGLMDRLGMEEDVPIEHRVISKSIEERPDQSRRAQLRYPQARRPVRRRDESPPRSDLRRPPPARSGRGHERADHRYDRRRDRGDRRPAFEEKVGAIDYPKIFHDYYVLIPNAKVTLDEMIDLPREDLIELARRRCRRAYQEVEARFGSEIMRTVERHVMLSIIDKLWVEHLTAMDDLREGVGLQAYGQKDPLVVYKTEGYGCSAC